MIDLEAFRTRWINERPNYEKLVSEVRHIIDQETKQRGIICSISGRPKEIGSFLNKIILKNYTSWEQITDKAGVRIVVTYAFSTTEVEEIIWENFTVHYYDNKAQNIEADRLGYQGIHFDISMKVGEFVGMPCEIQLQTRAQNLWSDISHPYYKPPIPVPPAIMRRVNRLEVLMELFDKEVSECYNDMMMADGYEEAYMLSRLEKNFYKLTARDYDKDLSLWIVSQLKLLYAPSDQKTYDRIIDTFVAQKEAILTRIFTNYYTDSRCNPLLFQPESLLIFERLECDRFRLTEEWSKILPIELLVSFADIWGVSIPSEIW
ncbi:MAG: RelA/SpoT domain-containing protein [Armatimonadetes bacterium]|nr:RelA/SpoT domain-containing protein [Armatimonadota bacterium]